MVLLHSYRAKLDFDESAHIGAALATGQGFSNPFGVPSGPTAWLAPVWPFVLSRIFVIFGVYTRAAIIAALFVNCTLSALTCIPVYFAARSTFGESIARQAAWTWTLFPYTMYWGMRWIWDTPLSALLLTTLFMMTLLLAESPNTWQWAVYGLLWGVAGLTNTAQLAFLPFAGIWICYRQFRQAKPFFGNAAMAAVLFFAVITPWMVRDYHVFHKFVPIRGNFGVEFHLGNTHGALGNWQLYLHPSQNILELRSYQQMGEAAYVKSKFDQARQFVHEEPGHFAFLTVARFFYYWSEPPHAENYPGIYEAKVGLFLACSVFAAWGLVLALRQRRPGAMLYLLLFLSYPTVYYITFPVTRYRHPVEPEMLMLVVFVISQLRTWDSEREEKRAVSDKPDR